MVREPRLKSLSQGCLGFRWRHETIALDLEAKRSRSSSIATSARPTI
jgi:hypothetical protein